MGDAQPDGLLWRRVSAGDADAFGELFTRHAAALHGYCFRRTADWGLAEDLVSVTFLEVWRRRDVALREHEVRAWLYGVTTNVLRNSRRSRKRHAAALKQLPREAAQPDFAASADARVDSERQMRELLVELHRLPAPEQDAVALVWWQGLPAAEAASALGVAEATIRTRLFRARRRLTSDAEALPVPPRPQPLRGGDEP